ncbi:MAG: sigma-54-dependent Fis family transcriptional regulator [bacterium]|nr:sigma-54-dependent Fis family transcriptional regulator [bacterium]
MQATLLVVDDDRDIREIIRQVAEIKDYEVIEAEDATVGLEKMRTMAPDLSILDVGLPGGIDGVELCQQIHEISPQHPVLIISGQATPEKAVEALKHGAFDYLGKPLNLEKLMLLVDRALSNVATAREIERVSDERKAVYGFDRLIGSCKQMEQVKDTGRKVAAVPSATVLLTGESGTGKELVAHAIHLASPNADKPFVEVNCAAMPEQLLEAELFGYEKGAFTDAKQRKRGLFEVASGGTFFLDEIGEMPLNLQVKLLKVIEERTFRRVGGTQPLQMKFRLIAATNAQLMEQIEQGKFRRDLYYRLAVFSIHLPPLRERNHDTVTIAQHFVDKFNREFGKSIKGIAPDAERLLISYNWPGNIRELRNAIERAVLIGAGPYIQSADLAILPMQDSPTPSKASMPEQDIDAMMMNANDGFQIDVPQNGVNMEEVEKQLIRIAMRHCHNNASAAARFLRMTRETLRYRLKKYGIREEIET